MDTKIALNVYDHCVEHNQLCPRLFCQGKKGSEKKKIKLVIAGSACVDIWLSNMNVKFKYLSNIVFALTFHSACSSNNCLGVPGLFFLRTVDEIGRCHCKVPAGADQNGEAGRGRCIHTRECEGFSSGSAGTFAGLPFESIQSNGDLHEHRHRCVSSLEIL